MSTWKQLFSVITVIDCCLEAAKESKHIPIKMKMPLSTDELIEGLVLISRQERLKLRGYDFFKGLITIVVVAFISFLFFGSNGIFIGVLVGGTAGLLQGKSSEPLWRIIIDMSDLEKVRLRNHMADIFNRLEINDILDLASVISGNRNGRAKKTIIKGLEVYFSQKWIY